MGIPYYSFTRITGISGSPSDYATLLTDAYDSSGNWDAEQYIKNRKKLEGWIIRGIGDALKTRYNEDWIIDHFKEIVLIFNHYKTPETSAEYIKTAIRYIKREARYHPYGIAWLIVAPDKITNWVSWRRHFSKDSDWRLFCALNLFECLKQGDDWIPIYSVSNLDRTAGMNRDTRTRTLNRLRESGWIDFQRNKSDTGISVKILKKLQNQPRPHPSNNLRPDFQDSPSRDPNLWYQIHRLLAGRPALTRPHRRYPLIYSEGKHLHFRLGTVSIRQLISSVYSENELATSWNKLRSDSGSFKLHLYAEKEVDEAPRKMPYPVDQEIIGNPHFNMLMDYQERVAFPAMDIGLPFNVDAARKLQYRLLMAYYGVGPNPLCIKNEKARIKNRYDIIGRYIQESLNWEDGRIRPFWYVRGTQANRTVLKNPDVQNLPKDLRFLLQNDNECLEWYDIKGQEIFIAIMESESKSGKQIIHEGRDLMQEIATDLGLEKKVVKKIIHPCQRGKSVKALKREHGEFIVDSVLDTFYRRVPETSQRKSRLEEDVIMNHGELPMTPLCRTPITIDRERVTTCASAVVDQSIGAEITKLWALNYNQTEEGRKYPIVLDMHDAIVAPAPQNETEEGEENRGATINKALEQATKTIGYPTTPQAENTTTGKHKDEGRRPDTRRPVTHYQDTYCGNLEYIGTGSACLYGDKMVFRPP